MKVHEHQGKEILRRFGVATPRGKVAFSVEEAVQAAQELGGEIWVVKAQIHAGGRGKGGGVKLARSLDELRTIAGAREQLRPTIGTWPGHSFVRLTQPTEAGVSATWPL